MRRVEVSPCDIMLPIFQFLYVMLDGELDRFTSLCDAEG